MGIVHHGVGWGEHIRAGAVEWKDDQGIDSS